jgi:hypothetical protein
MGLLLLAYACWLIVVGLWSFRIQTTEIIRREKKSTGSAPAFPPGWLNKEPAFTTKHNGTAKQSQLKTATLVLYE